MKLSNEVADKLRSKKAELERLQAQRDYRATTTTREIAALINAGDLESRLKLRAELTKYIRRIELFPNGLPRSIRIKGHADKAFRVHFKNGDAAIVGIHEGKVQTYVSPLGTKESYYW